MDEKIIEVINLEKEFKVYERKKGFLSFLRNLIEFDYKIVKAVKGINFAINKGEMVGFIGPNGAGKSTTIKMLCGILVPTAGSVKINGLNPTKHRKSIARNIGVVFGQKTQLIWDLPVVESFLLLKDVYDIPGSKYKQNLELFQELLGINEFINRPVRQLSLGQRMKADICASLLHDPVTIFFDEPTIGLDVVAKENIRQFIKKINREKNITIIFTTHDMSDIEKTCHRLILIDAGQIIYDGSLSRIKDYMIPERLITVQFENYTEQLNVGDLQIEAITDEPDNKKTFRVKNDVAHTKALITRIFEQYKIKDISISTPEIESVIRDIYNKKIDLQQLN